MKRENVLIYDLGNKQWDIPALRTLLENILPEKSVLMILRLPYFEILVN
jgi:two-component system CheB/CheR fusion protein